MFRRCVLLRAASEVAFEELGAVKCVTLDRPKALNALTLQMVRDMVPLYRRWATDPDAVILLKGSGERAFCAGGDVVRIANEEDYQRNFFYEEYQLNYIISQLTIPHVSLYRGVVMGGGVGLSVHGSHRVATDTSVFAMPETAIGLFPDVGGSWALPRARSPAFGLYLGLTGVRLKGYDLKAAGIATHYVPADRMDALEAALTTLPKGGHDAVNEVLAAHAGADDPTAFSLAQHLDAIDSCFGNLPSVPDVFHRLESLGTEWGDKTAKLLRQMSPTSLVLTHELLTRGAQLTDIKDAFEMEYNVTQGVTQLGTDFFEGVRAVLTDKDKNPKWNPPTLEEVSDSEVAKYFMLRSGNRSWVPLDDDTTAAAL